MKKLTVEEWKYILCDGIYQFVAVIDDEWVETGRCLDWEFGCEETWELLKYDLTDGQRLLGDSDYVIGGTRITDDGARRITVEELDNYRSFCVAYKQATKVK